MDVAEKAKQLLLGESCANCKYLEYDTSYPPIQEIEINGVFQKYQPTSIIIKLYCKFENNIKDYENYCCEHWEEGKNLFTLTMEFMKSYKDK